MSSTGRSSNNTQIKLERLRPTVNNYECINEILDFVDQHGSSALKKVNADFKQLVADWESRNIVGKDADDIRSGLNMLGLIHNDQLTDFGRKILENRDKPLYAKNALAKKMLIEKNGWAYCHILFHLSGKARDEIRDAYKEFYDPEISEQLTEISKYNNFLVWLEIAKDLGGGKYEFLKSGFRKRLGLKIDEFDFMSELTKEAQYCYLALIKLSNGRKTSIAVSQIRSEYGHLTGKETAKLTMVIDSVGNALKKAGLIKVIQPRPSGNRLNRGRKKSWEIIPSVNAFKSIHTAMFETFFRNKKPLSSLKTIFDKSFVDVIKKMKAKKSDTRGRALENFAVKICWLLDIRNLEVRARDKTEKDVIGSRQTPFYTNFLVQCKNQTKGTVGVAVVAKELGTAWKEKFNNILIFSTTGFSSLVPEYCKEAMVLTGVNIFLFDKDDIKKISSDQNQLLELMKKKNSDIEDVRTGMDKILEELSRNPDWKAQMVKMGWTPP